MLLLLTMLAECTAGVGTRCDSPLVAFPVFPSRCSDNVNNTFMRATGDPQWHSSVAPAAAAVGQDAS